MPQQMGAAWSKYFESQKQTLKVDEWYAIGEYVKRINDATEILRTYTKNFKKIPKWEKIQMKKDLQKPLQDLGIHQQWDLTYFIQAKNVDVLEEALQASKGTSGVVDSEQYADALQILKTWSNLFSNGELDLKSSDAILESIRAWKDWATVQK